MFYIYILKSVKDQGLYIGYTKNLRKRFKQHQQGHNKATKHRLPLQLTFYEAFINQADAKAREKFLKSGHGRRQLKSILKNAFR